MKAALISGPHALEIATQTPTDPGPNEVQISVDLVGVCATDVHIFEGEFPKAKLPLVPGHEFTGVVSKVGSEVNAISVGDRVAIDPAVACNSCEFCSRDRRNLCKDREAYGITLPGGMAETANVRAQNCYVLKNVPAEAAVLTEPLACVVHAFERLGEVRGLSVLVLGAGAIGLLSTQVALTRGAAQVAQVDLSSNRLEAARQIGANEVAESISGLTLGSWDVVVDATGAAAAISEGIDALARGGTLLQIGVSEPDSTISVSPFRIFADELRIIGSLTTEGNFPEAVRLIETGVIRYALITGEPVGLESLDFALRNPRVAKSPKVVVRPH